MKRKIFLETTPCPLSPSKWDIAVVFKRIILRNIVFTCPNLAILTPLNKALPSISEVYVFIADPEWLPNTVKKFSLLTLNRYSPSPCGRKHMLKAGELYCSDLNLAEPSRSLDNNVYNQV